MLEQFFRSVLEQDEAAVVLCDLNHTIVYMNPAAAKRYEARGGYKLVGESLLGCHSRESCSIIETVIGWFRESENHNRFYTFYNEKENKDVYTYAVTRWLKKKKMIDVFDTDIKYNIIGK